MAWDRPRDTAVGVEHSTRLLDRVFYGRRQGDQAAAHHSIDFIQDTVDMLRGIT